MLLNMAPKGTEEEEANLIRMVRDGGQLYEELQVDFDVEEEDNEADEIVRMFT